MVGWVTITKVPCARKEVPHHISLSLSRESPPQATACRRAAAFLNFHALEVLLAIVAKMRSLKFKGKGRVESKPQTDSPNGASSRHF